MIISHKPHKARKAYKCELSGRTINAGEEYISVTQKVDNDFYTIKVCEKAWDLVLDAWDCFENAICDCLDKDLYIDLKDTD